MSHIHSRWNGRVRPATHPRCSVGVLALLLTIAFPFAARGQDPISLANSSLTAAVIEAVARHSPRLEAARAAIRAAEARAGAAGLTPPAVLSAEMDDVPNGFDVADAGFRVEIGREFLTGGRSDAARALAAAEVGVAQARFDATARGLRARTLRHLARIVVATGVARRLAAEDSLLLSTQEHLQPRFAVGGAPYVHVLRLRTERLRVQTDLAEALAEARAERALLSGLAGTKGAPEIEALIDSTTLYPAVADREALPAAPPLDSLLALAGEIRMAEAAVERAIAARHQALAERRPRLSAAIGAQRRLEGGRSSFGPVVSGSISLPFTAGRANRALAEAAEREVAATEADLDAAEASVRAELLAAMARYEAARERVAAFDATLLEGARQEREAALGAYQSDSLSLIELLDFERALARAEIERLRARADAAEAYANLISATGGTR